MSEKMDTAVIAGLRIFVDRHRRAVAEAQAEQVTVDSELIAAGDWLAAFIDTVEQGESMALSAMQSESMDQAFKSALLLVAIQHALAPERGLLRRVPRAPGDGLGSFIDGRVRISVSDVDAVGGMQMHMKPGGTAVMGAPAREIDLILRRPH